MIIVTAGHYGSAKGASNDEGFTEYPETREWAEHLTQCLGDKAIYVPSTTLGIKVRRINKICAEQKVTLAIEIHFNSAKDATGNHVGQGSETLYCPASAEGLRMATKVQAVLGKQFKPDRGVKQGYYRRRATSGPLYFLKYTHCPAIIIEPEFIQFKDKIIKGRCRCCHALSEVLKTF